MVYLLEAFRFEEEDEIQLTVFSLEKYTLESFLVPLFIRKGNTAIFPLNYFFLVWYKKICLEEGEVWRKAFSNKLIVTLVTQGLRSSFLSRPVCAYYFIMRKSRTRIRPHLKI